MNKKNFTELQKNHIENAVLEYAYMTEKELLDTFSSSMQGLDSDTALLYRQEFGENEITTAKAQPWFVRLLLSFVNPFSIVLLIVAAVSFITEVLVSDEPAWATVIIILVLISISGIVQFVQESRSDSAAEKLKSMVSSTAAVVRDGVPSEIPMEEIVPGDIVLLSAGDMMPADMRILSAKDLFVGQASLTGESAPVEKFAEVKGRPGSSLEASDICFMGCNVVSGSATGIVIGTGNNTYLGTIAKDLTGRTAETSFEQGVSSVSKLLLRLMMVMVPIIFVVNGFTKHDWVSALLFALSVAVGLTPELLPVIMSSTLAKGAVAMSKRKTIVKNLSAIQSFGAMDVLCTDKTGTLTEDKIILERYLDIHGNQDLRVLRHAYLNSYFQTGLKNLMDVAIITRAVKFQLGDVLPQFEKVDEIPFDFTRRRMSVVIEKHTDGKRQLITKGAVEEMLGICSFAEYQGQVIPLTEEIRSEVLLESDELNEQGLRVVAVAQKNEVRDAGSFNVDDERDMVLLGFVGFLDPPKKSSQKATAALHAHGVRVVVLTGDNEKVARTVCRQVGIDAEDYLLGEDVEGMSDGDLSAATGRINLFAKLSPTQKARVVRLLQADGHTVGYMGDGINDAPAMHQADVGISVDSAVDIAKETADIILLEKDLMVLEEGVVEGRRTFGNIVKYIKMASSGNFGNMFSVLAASLFLPFLPMLPTQILTQNLLYDFSQIAIPLDRMDPEYLEKPQKWDTKGIARFMFWMGPVSSLFDILTFLVLYFVFKANSPVNESLFQTGWFLMGLISQTLIVHLVRTSKKPFIESRAAWPLLLSTGLITVAGLIIPYTFVGEALKMTAMPLLYFVWLAAILILYAAAVQIVKSFFIKKYGHWI